jgi:hypothetical protein
MSTLSKKYFLVEAQDKAKKRRVSIDSQFDRKNATRRCRTEAAELGIFPAKDAKAQSLEGEVFTTE